MHRWTIFAVVFTPFFAFVLSFFLRQNMGSFLLSVACLISLNSCLGFIYRFPDTCNYSFFSQRTTALKNNGKWPNDFALYCKRAVVSNWRLMMDGHVARKLTWRLSATRRICAWLCSGYDQDVFDLKKIMRIIRMIWLDNFPTFSCSKKGILFFLPKEESPIAPWLTLQAFYKWSFLVPLIGGRWYIISQ